MTACTKHDSCNAAADLHNPKHDGPRPNMSGRDARDSAPAGIYHIFWKDGSTSLGAVGISHDGLRWLAPINWVHAGSVAHWGHVNHIVPALIATVRP